MYYEFKVPYDYMVTIHYAKIKFVKLNRVVEIREETFIGVRAYWMT